MLSENIPSNELISRWNRCRRLLLQSIPEAHGVLVFSRLNIYYFTGSFANGVFWLPLEGDPILFCRRGIERARIESPVPHIHSFSTYSDIEAIMLELGSPLPVQIAAEMNGLPWRLANSLVRHLAGRHFLPGDKVLGMCRARKSAWELDILREAGARHARCLTELLPRVLHEGMSELEIAHRISEIFFAEGHLGILRMKNFGEEAFLGHIAVGDSANHPSVFNGPVGLRGVHPATPCMGSAEVRWTVGQPLTIDNGFTLAGYMTDKTQVYWLGALESFPAAGRTAHDFCIDLQEQIASRLRPGALPSNIWSHCLTAAEKAGWSEGFMGLGGNKVSFVGHGIGLAIDEYPVLAKGFDLPLEEGMTLAIEPKIGMPGFGMVGVENTFEVTPEGGRSLTGGNFAILNL